MSYHECPICGEEIEFVCVAGPDYDVNVGPEFDLTEFHPCQPKWTDEQDQALYDAACKAYWEGPSEP